MTKDDLTSLEAEILALEAEEESQEPPTIKPKYSKKTTWEKEEIIKQIRDF